MAFQVYVRHLFNGCVDATVTIDNIKISIFLDQDERVAVAKHLREVADDLYLDESTSEQENSLCFGVVTLAEVQPTNENKPRPSADPPSKPARSTRESAKTGPTPDYNEERAWTEYERNREIRLKNEMLEGKLVYKEDIES